MDELPEPVGVVSTLMEPATSKTITKPKLFKRCEDLPAGTYLHTEEQLREAVRREREQCAELYGTGDVAAPIGHSAWGEAYQEGWIAGTQAYRDAIRARNP